MDSLLVILAVIGVVMILAGVARMKSKKKQSWDDIDHSVLFTKNDDEAVESVGEARLVTANAGVSTGTATSARSPSRQDDVPSVVIDANEDNGLTAEEEFHYLDNLLTEKDEQKGDKVSVSIDEDDRPVPASSNAEKHESKPTEKARTFFEKLRTPVDADDDDEEESLLDPCYRQGAPEKVVVLNVMAPKGMHFSGPALVDAIEHNGLMHGEMDIFHLQRGTESMFSVVNMVKPGVFDLDSIESMTTPGVSLFIQLPNNLGNCVSAFDTMLDIARTLATDLGGELRDETRSVLTQSAIDHMREQLIEYDCKWLVH